MGIVRPNTEKLITASGLTKTFPLKRSRNREGRRGILPGKKQVKTALDSVAFSVSSGEAIGIIGKNGSGKSTLLKLISGITAPSSGTISVRGRISALLELGAGFHPEYTGIQNIYLNGTLNGRTRAETKAQLPEILRFADIGAYAEQPVKTYSDGMFVRLAFAAAAYSTPDILVVDEALAVGDFQFQAKCFRKFEELKQQGVTILYVTHDIDTVRKFCTRAIWMENGKIRMDGAVGTVTSAYMEWAVGGDGMKKTSKMLRRFGSHTGAIKSFSCPSFLSWGQQAECIASLFVPWDADPLDLAVSLSVRNREGLDLLVLSTADMGIPLHPGREETISFRFQNLLCSGKYAVSISLERRSTTPITYYDYCEGIAMFEVRTEPSYFGLFHTPAEVEVHEEIQA